jgi:hypothetical protein
VRSPFSNPTSNTYTSCTSLTTHARTMTENADAGPSKAREPVPVKGYNYEEDVEDDHPQKRYYITVPSTMLASTPMAATIGFFLGARRGAVKARLQFLAENAHRQPTTVQGWVS